MVYLVIKQGIYRHEITGIFERKTLALQSAYFDIKHERDDYHHYVIAEAELNTPIEDVKGILIIKRIDKKVSGGVEMKIIEWVPDEP